MQFDVNLNPCQVIKYACRFDTLRGKYQSSIPNMKFTNQERFEMVDKDFNLITNVEKSVLFLFVFIYV